MLPPSCDPGYACSASTSAPTTCSRRDVLRLRLGAAARPAQGTAASYFPTAASFAADNPPFLAYSAIGQENVRATALQDALVAAAVGNGGVEMTPHLMSYVTGRTAQVVERYKDSVWKTPLTRPRPPIHRP
jgi:hypothetical protein